MLTIRGTTRARYITTAVLLFVMAGLYGCLPQGDRRDYQQQKMQTQDALADNTAMSMVSTLDLVIAEYLDWLEQPTTSQDSMEETTEDNANFPLLNTNAIDGITTYECSDKQVEGRFAYDSPCHVQFFIKNDGPQLRFHQEDLDNQEIGPFCKMAIRKNAPMCEESGEDDTGDVVSPVQSLFAGTPRLPVNFCDHLGDDAFGGLYVYVGEDEIKGLGKMEGHASEIIQTHLKNRNQSGYRVFTKETMTDMANEIGDCFSDIANNEHIPDGAPIVLASINESVFVPDQDTTTGSNSSGPDGSNPSGPDGSNSSGPDDSNPSGLNLDNVTQIHDEIINDLNFNVSDAIEIRFGTHWLDKFNNDLAREFVTGSEPESYEVSVWCVEGSTLPECNPEPEPEEPTAPLFDFELPEGEAIYISSIHGNDDNTGESPDQAWASLERLEEFDLSEYSYVALERGSEWHNVSLHFDGLGANGRIVNFVAYGDGPKPRIKGSKIITNTFTKVSDNLWRVTDDTLPAYIPKERESLGHVFMNGQRQEMARYPQTGYLESEAGGGTYILDQDHSWPTGYWGGGLAIIKGKPWNWSPFRIGRNDTHTLNAYPGSNASDASRTSSGPYYLIRNHPNAADHEGEWAHIDSNLYIYSSSDPNQQTIEASVQDIVFDFNNSRVGFINVVVEHANLYNIKAHNSELTLKGAEIVHSAAMGIYTKDSKINVTNSKIHDIFGAGIYTYSSSGVIENSVFTQIGTEQGLRNLRKTGYQQGAGIHFQHNNGEFLVRNNIFENIAIGVQTHSSHHPWTVENNIFRNYAMYVSDLGAIYCGGDWREDVTKTIRGNIFADGNIAAKDSYKGTMALGNAIYLDYSTGGMLIEDNFVVNANTAFHLHVTKSNNRFIGNTIYNGTGSHIKETPWNSVFWFNNGGAGPEEPYITNNVTINDNRIVFGPGDEGNKHGIQFFYKDRDKNHMFTNKVDSNTYYTPFEDISTLYMHQWDYGAYRMHGLGWNGWGSNSRIVNDYKYRPGQGVSKEEFVLPVYNWSPAPMSFNLGSSRYVDLDGNTLSGTVTIPPYSGKVMFHQSGSPVRWSQPNLQNLVENINTSVSNPNLPQPGQEPNTEEPGSTHEINLGSYVFHHDFQNDTPGEYRENEWRRDWQNPVRIYKDENLKYGDILTEGDNKFLRFTFPEGSFLYSSMYQWFLELPQRYNDLYLSYRVRYSPNFTSDYDGKIPGLCGGTCRSGGVLPDGTDAWTARYMFHGPRMRFYLYHPELYKVYGDPAPVPGKNYYGESVGFNADTQVDQWYHVTQRIVMNTPGGHDGYVEAYVDGKLVARKGGIMWRTTHNLGIEYLYFTSFLGGSGEKPTEDIYVDIDDVTIFTPEQLGGNSLSDVVKKKVIEDNSTPPISDSGPVGDYLISHNQSYYTHENAKNGDDLGKFFVNFTDNTKANPTYEGGSYSFSIVSGNTNNAFAINSSTGMITVNNASALSYGNDYQLTVNVREGSRSQNYTADIHIANPSKTVYIDHSFSGPELGTYSRPYNRFRNDITPQSGTYYFFRRGRPAAHDQIHITDNGLSDIVVSAYGAGDRPVLHYSSPGGEGIVIGRESTSENVNNIIISDIDVRGTTNSLVRQNYSADNIYWMRMKVGGNTDTSYGFYQKHHNSAPLTRLYIKDVEVYDTHCHGIKMEGRGSEIINAHVKDPNNNCKAMSFSVQPNHTAKFIYLEGAQPSLLEINAGHLDVEHFYVEDGWHGVEVYSSNNLDTVSLKKGYVVNTRSSGISLSDNATNITLDTITIDGSSQSDGIGIRNNASNISGNNLVIKNNDGFGINKSGSGNNITFSNITFSNNGSGEVSGNNLTVNGTSY